MKIGYARVSTSEQNLDMQVDALQKAGCERIETDKASGAKLERPGLDKLINDVLRKGDTLVVWKLDRLARSLRQLIDLVERLQSRGIELITLQESIDTTSPAGKLTYHIFAALAEFERDLIRVRTQAGLEAARARGKIGGRPQKLNSKQIDLARKLYREKQHSIMEICELIGVSKPTVYRYLNKK
jgi:DNA invertase Pin-like site-specific DNA recombinase